MTRDAVDEETLELGEGATLTVRPIRPNDKEALAAALERTSETSRYARFLSPVAGLSTGELRYLTEVDHHDHEALVAVDPAGDGVGVARYVRSKTDPRSAEVAVIVVDDWQRRGVGSALLDRIAARARDAGVERFTATVLASNERAVAMLERLGPTERLGTDHGVAELRVELPATPGRQTPLAEALRAAASGGITGAARMWRSLVDALGR